MTSLRVLFQAVAVVSIAACGIVGRREQFHRRPTPDRAWA